MVTEYDGQSGIQRDCAEVPEGPIENECKIGDLGGMHGTLCYCHGENCNSGDVHTSSTKTTPKTTPSPPHIRCLLCGVDEDCFNDPDVDGESTECDNYKDVGCYKASVGN